MGSSFSRYSSSSSNNNNNNNTDENNNNRPTKRKRVSNSSNNDDVREEVKEEVDDDNIIAITTISMSTHNCNTTESTRTTVLEVEALQHDLQHIENGLRERRGILFSTSDNDDDNNDDDVNRSGSIRCNHHGGGRALFESMGSALDNIRNRLHLLTSPAAAAGITTTTTNPTPTIEEPSQSQSEEEEEDNVSIINTSIRNISQRLSIAEQSHSTRIPLNILQLQQSQSQSELVSSEEIVDVDLDAPPLPPPLPPQRRRSSQQMQRRSSVLSASRTTGEQQQHDDVTVFATGFTIEVTPTAAAATSDSRRNNLLNMSSSSLRSITGTGGTGTGLGGSLLLPTLEERQSLLERERESFVTTTTTEEEADNDDYNSDDDDDDDDGDNYTALASMTRPADIVKVLLVPESIRKQLLEDTTSDSRGSLKLFSEDAVNANANTNTNLVVAKDKVEEDNEVIDDDIVNNVEEETTAIATTTSTARTTTMEIYTWGSLHFKSSSSDSSSAVSSVDEDCGTGAGENNNESTMTTTATTTTYQFFGTETEGQKKIINNNIEKNVPQRIPSDTRLGRSNDIVSMSTSQSHCGFVTSSSGRLLICGNNSCGQVDPSQRNVTTIPRPIHLEVLAMNRIKQVSCGIDHTAAITETKSVLTWGSNTYGQLGHRRAKRGSIKFLNRLILETGSVCSSSRREGQASDVACGDGYTLVLTTRMEVFMAGREEIVTGSFNNHSTCTNDNMNNQSQEASDLLFFPLPQQNSVLKGVPLVGLSAGLQHAVVWTAFGSAYAWGNNAFGQCGREFPRQLTIPVPIAVPKSSHKKPSSSPVPNTNTLGTNWNVWSESGESISLAKDVNIVDAACGKNHTILLTESGRLLVCGSNADGQFPSSASQSTSNNSKLQVIAHPEQPERRFECVKAGTNHALILDDIGHLYEMGHGELLMKQFASSSSSSSSTLDSPPPIISSIAVGGMLNFVISKPKHDDINSHSCSMVPPNMAGVDDLMSIIRSENDKTMDTSNNNGDSGLGATDSSCTGLLRSVEDLAGRTEELFRSPAVMNTLFMNPKEIDDMYQTLIYKCPNIYVKQRIVAAIEKGMLLGLGSMVEARLMHFESVRFLLLYLQCPLWRDQEKEEGNEKEVADGGNDSKPNDSNSAVPFDVRGNLLFLLCETIIGLPFEGYKAFLSWSVTLYGEELFVPFLVKPLVYQLNYRFINQITHGVPMLCGVLLWFHTLNEQRSDQNLARCEDFYCLGIEAMPMEALYEDLSTYEMATDGQRSSNFFLVAHPFLISPTVKQDLLQVESQMSMVEAAQAGGVTFDPDTREFKFKPYFVLAIDRKYLLPQTLQAVAKASTTELRKSLKIVFKGEDGVDAGGVTKEFFQLLCDKLFDVNTGMWTTSSTNDTWFNSVCTWNGEGYYLVGVLCGLAVYNTVILDVHFPHAIYRKLLRLPLGLEDLIDEDVRKGLKTLLEYDGDDAEDIFCLNFEITWMVLGQQQKKELKPGGSDIAVTSENKEEYVMLYVKWLLVDSIGPQYDEFERGFMTVMEDSSLEILLAEELELLVTGTPELDFYALEKSSTYEGGYDTDSTVVKNIWKWIQSASLTTQESFLKFCTGSSKGK
jgi:ubiquitin-protein ligase E3 A